MDSCSCYCENLCYDFFTFLEDESYLTVLRALIESDFPNFMTALTDIMCRLLQLVCTSRRTFSTVSKYYKKFKRQFGKSYGS